MKKLVIIGGSNIDYIAKSKDNLIEKDSNPGHLTITFGGVARNIAENLARLGLSFPFFTAIGSDACGTMLEKELNDLGIKVIKPKGIYNSSSYIAIHDKDGDMVVGINDMDIITKIDVNFINEYNNILFNSDIIVIDGNLDESTIYYVCEKYQDKLIIADGISTTKVKKLKNVLQFLDLIKVNKLEYDTLNEISDLSKFPNLNIVVSNGSNKVELINDKITCFDVVKKDNIVSATGAGDAMLAGIIYGLVNNVCLSKAINYGIKLASVTLDTMLPVNKVITKDILEEENE